MERKCEDSSKDSGEFKCIICGRRYGKKRYLDQHKQCHMPKRTCAFCGKTYTFVQDLRAHHKRAHGLLSRKSTKPYSKTFPCEICGKVYGRKFNLSRHEASVHRQPSLEQSRSQYICGHCNRSYGSYEELINHIEDQHPLNQHGGRRAPPPSNDTISSVVAPDDLPENNIEDKVENLEESRDISDERALQNAVQNRSIYPKHGERYDVLPFFANVREQVRSFLLDRVQSLRGIKWNLCVEVEMQRDEGAESNVSTPHFRSRTYFMLTPDDMDEHDLNEAFQKMYASLENFIKQGSGWYVKKVMKLDIHTVVYRPISGSSFIPLPTTLSRSHSILNIENQDNKCLVYCVLASLHPAEVNPECVSHYQPYESELDMTGIKYPVQLSQLNIFERQNANISINVFALDDSNAIVPLRVTSCTRRLHHVNLLYMKDERASHYCLITDLNRFLSRTKTQTNKLYFCQFCLHAFSCERLLSCHLDYYSTNAPQRVELPIPGENDVLKFNEYQKTLKVPFVIYADFETVNVKLHTCAPNPSKSATTPTTKLEVCSFGYKVVCEDERYSKPTVSYRGPDAATKLISCLLEEQKEIRQILSHVQPMKLGSKHLGLIEKETNCCLCKKDFTPYDRIYKNIVTHHNHLTGEIIGAACNSCNLKCKQAKFTCVMFHNLRDFDAHIICEKLGQFKEHKLSCIANNSERYVSFSLGDLRFLDSLQFLPSSLANLVDDLKVDGPAAFKHTIGEFESLEKVEMLLRKGVYPYDYMDSFDRFDEPELPPIEEFYSKVKKEGISDEDYVHAKTVFHAFDMTSLGDYHDLYLKSDVCLLADVFESFRNMCLGQYELDPCQFYTSPGLSWGSLLKMTDVKLDLLTDIDQVLMIEAGIRGGLSQISNRYKKANNPYLSDYDSNKSTSYIQYLDANNLYGWAMAQPLPVGDFQFIDVENFDIMAVPEDSEQGYILEISLRYPSDLHDLHACLPLAPERKLISNDQLSPHAQHLLRKMLSLSENDPLPSTGNVKKLLTTLEDKDHYILHYRNLQLYVQLGMQIKSVHRILRFKQEPWMKKYIDHNTTMRQKSTSNFQKYFYKLMNVSVFGKTMEDVRKHKDIELVHRQERLQKLTAKPTYKNTTIFSEDLVAVELLKSKVRLYKPSYSGMCILDLSKLLMYDFWYNYIKGRYGSRAELQMTDTDSLLFSCETEDIYADMQSCIDMFDTSDYPEEHPLYNQRQKKVVGRMKDETNGTPISEFIGLRSKMYSYLCAGKEEKRAKGISKATLKKELRHQNYKDVLFEETRMVSSMTTLRSHKHELFCETVQKSGLSAFDDKRYLIDNIKSYPYGHYRISQSGNVINPVTILNVENNESLELRSDQCFMIDDMKITPCVLK